MRSILQGQDVFVLMPTGGGKSLCYQLPALLLDGLTVVVSPLIALMKDQVDGLRALGVAATFINSSLDPFEIGQRQAAVARGDVKLLYVAPERLMLAGFLHLLSSVRIALFAIDEAHCISEWGHDFRPEYRELKRLRDVFPYTALGAFTATATRRVQDDIKAQLGLQKAAIFQGSFNRPNLFYEVRPKQDAFEQLVAYLREHRQASGIVYCNTRAETERLATKLQSCGFSATAYHAGLEGDERRQRQEAFIKDDIQIYASNVLGPRLQPQRKRSGELSDTVKATLSLFNEGRTVADIASIRQLALTTVEGHLAEAIQLGEQVPLARLVGEDKRRAIEKAMAELGTIPLKPIMERLRDGYTYGELRLVRAALSVTP